MIHVEKIVIKEFRGIRDLTIDFKGKNFAVCGPNGTGKSGVVDALEFALTGSISRLSGRGTGGISVKEHAPHVDSRNRPDKALVILTVSIPKLNKQVVIERTVKDPLAATITPRSPEVLAVLHQVGSHPEFALSRRELIRYVISAPGDRAKEVQALLRLDAVENLRVILQRFANSYQREVAPLKRERQQARDHLLRSLEIPDLDSERLVVAVNTRRSLLGLGPIPVLTPTTSLRDGLTGSPPAARPRVPKQQATADIKKVRETLAALTETETTTLRTRVTRELTNLSGDPLVVANVEKERFLQSAITLIESETCPVCDTAWNAAELKERIGLKLKLLQQAATKRATAERRLEPFLSRLEEVIEAMAVVERYGALLTPVVNTNPIRNCRVAMQARRRDIQAFLPLTATLTALEEFAQVPADALETIVALETAIAALPDPTGQDAARDYLTVCQERLEAYRGVSLRLKQTEERATFTRNIYDAYARASTSVLDGIYKQVEKDFSELYRFINREDEGKFSAQLIPSIGKLGFDVDFYGRGFFPPGAYHSEGHQDGMGLCLYLALMKYLQGDAFTFAVLDDVLMSVDTGHRREVCNLLTERFPDTQFILTTHDEIWLRHMRSVGLLPPRAFVHFRKWYVDHGPTEWDDRDVWREIDDDLERNDVQGAAGLLRHYLEFISAEICHRIRAPVEFRGDAQFQLGELLPAAIGQFRKLLRMGKESATSWQQTKEVEAITAREVEFAATTEASNVEQWQINPAIHYNEWVNLQSADFRPVVTAHRRLTESFLCSVSGCDRALYVVPERGHPETLKCTCGATNINLRRKAQ